MKVNKISEGWERKKNSGANRGRRTRKNRRRGWGLKLQGRKKKENKKGPDTHAQHVGEKQGHVSYT